jgi:lipoteichoic acid synthase
VIQKLKLKITQFYNEYFGFFMLSIVLAWAKTYISYHLDFSLGVKGWLQHLILLINPIALTMLLFSLALFRMDTKKRYRTLFIIYILNSLLLYANIIYYREFSDFLTFSTILSAKVIPGSGSSLSSVISTVNTFISSSLIPLVRWYDFIYWIDLILLFMLLRKGSSLITVDLKVFSTKSNRWRTVGIAMLICLVNLGMAEISRPQLLTRTFDRNYIVKYLGINGFAAYDSIQTVKAESSDQPVSSQDVKEVVDIVNNRYAQPSPATFGIAEGRNVITIHLESMQQFLIDYKLSDEEGKEWEVLPFLNQLYHSEDTLSFSNIYAQIGQGKSSDAELLVETSLFGLPQGAAFIKHSDNAFYAMPKILKDKMEYTSAAFHGNVGSFWNRNDMYKSFGYDYFFDAGDFTLTEENTAQYGLKDKLFFQQSAKYLEQLQQPFYAKFVTLSNHFPFPYDEMNDTFPQANTRDNSVNGYFATSNYADQALEEFFNYLKEIDIYDNCIFVLYGDHFGISDSRHDTLAPLLGRDPETWTEFDDLQMKRVPFMIHIPGYGGGGEIETLGGQVDILPTVLHLLGIDTKTFIIMGQDLLAPGKQETIVFRNGDIISPIYTVIGENVYYTKTGDPVPDNMSYTYDKAYKLKEEAANLLETSDRILKTNLLDYYRPKGLTPVNTALYDYSDDWAKLMEHAQKSGMQNTSVFYQNGSVSTVSLYKTNAPEFKSSNSPSSLGKDKKERKDTMDDYKGW